MADPQHLREFQKGVASWNQWKFDHRTVVPELSLADLSRAFLMGQNPTLVS